MSAAWLSLVALIVALAVSMTTRVNVGWLAIVFAWVIGVYHAGMRPEVVMGGFPVTLFLTLVGVTLLFAIAEANGALAVLATRVIRLARGDVRIVPVILFLLSCAISSIGPGAISTVALLIPLAMAVGTQVGVPPLVTALMVANGANAGNLSPFSSVGVIANSAMAKAGLAGFEGRVWFANFAAHVVVGMAAYLWLAVLMRPARGTLVRSDAEADRRVHTGAGPPATSAQRLTFAVIAAWIAGVLAFDLSLGFSAFAASTLLLLARTGDETAAVRRVPWGIIMMVCGVTVLIGVLDKTGGMELFTAMLARTASPASINGVIAFVTGAISTYSSTSGVVLPAFLPTVPGLVERIGGGDPLAIALSINVGSSLVDVSPLSTLGALCVAAVPQHDDARALFRALLAWGVSMTIVGAALCHVLAPLVAAR